MTPEEAIQVADELLLAHAHNPLTDIQRMILRESLAGKSYEHMEGYATQHIKNEGKQLWDLLSNALGEKVSKPSFKGALEKRLQLGRLSGEAANSKDDAELMEIAMMRAMALTEIEQEIKFIIAQAQLVQTRSQSAIDLTQVIATFLKTLVDDLKSFTLDYDADLSDERTFGNAIAVAKRKEFERFYIEFIARTVSKTEVDSVRELTEQFSEWKEELS
jgi:hypothetical protein